MTPELEEFDDPTERFLSLRLAFLIGSHDEWIKAVSTGGGVGETVSSKAGSDDRGSSEATGT